MKKSIKIIVGLLSLSLFIGGGFMINPLKAASIAQASNNKMTRGTWDINITAVDFSQRAGQKIASVTLQIENPAGRDKVVTPTGYIAGIVGSTGKEYPIVMVDVSLHEDRELGKQIKAQAADPKTKEMYARLGKALTPGFYDQTNQVVVDQVEETITALIYKDENGNITNIPINIKPTTTLFTDPGTGK